MLSVLSVVCTFCCLYLLLSVPSVISSFCCQYLLLSVSSVISTFRYKYLLLSVPSVVCTFCCLYLLLSVPSAVSTFSCLYLLLSVPSVISTFCCQYLQLSVSSVVRTFNSAAILTLFYFRCLACWPVCILFLVHYSIIRILKWNQPFVNSHNSNILGKDASKLCANSCNFVEYLITFSGIRYKQTRCKELFVSKPVVSRYYMSI